MGLAEQVAVGPLAEAVKLLAIEVGLADQAGAVARLAQQARRYPVIYWLHGLGSDPGRGAAFVTYLQQAIAQGIAPAVIAVLVNGLRNGWYCDSKDGRWPVETVIIKELIPHVDATYRTIATRETRLIEGQSMGGFGAARLGFGHPDLFGAVSIGAGARLDLHEARDLAIWRTGIYRSIWGRDDGYLDACNPSAIVRRNADAIRGRTTVRISVGDQDALLPGNERFHALLLELGIAHEFIVVPGVGHNYPVRTARMGIGSFAFFARALAAAGR